MHEHVTLVRPDASGLEARGISAALPADLLGQSAARLRVLALLYAFAFFMAGICERGAMARCPYRSATPHWRSS